MNKQGTVYILSNKNRTVLYIGVTNDLERRLMEHRYDNKISFVTRYNCFDLLYFEIIDGMEYAIEREKQLKNWHKEWKWNLIKESNPNLEDLSKKIGLEPYKH